MANSGSPFPLPESTAAVLTPASGRHVFSTANKMLRASRSALLVGVCYYIGTRIGFALTPVGQPNSTFWPPNAFLMAALLLSPQRTWWRLILAVLPAHMFAQMQTGVPLWMAVGWFISNTSEALIGAFCIRRLTSDKTLFSSVRGTTIFIVLGVLMAPLATSFLDAGAVIITGWGRHFWPLSTERFWTNTLAELTIVPAIVVCGSNGLSWIRNVSLRRYCEAGLLAVATILVAVSVFGLEHVSVAGTPALLYVPLPLFLWATARFGPGGLSLSVLSVALISISYAMHGRMPFPYTSMPQNIMSLQILFCGIMVPLLFLSAVMAEAKHSQDALRDLSSRLIVAQEQERQRIARDLHDDLVQRVALAAAQLNSVMEKDNQPSHPGLTDLSQQLLAISTATHEISHALYPTQLEYLGLASALKKLCDGVQHGNLSVQLDTGDLPQVGSTLALCLYRIVQEALHNVLTHSQANNVRIDLRRIGGKILLRIIDDGIGFDLSREGAGLGLRSMRERVRSVGGSIEIRSSQDLGTQIEARVPLQGDKTAGVSDAA